MNYYEYEEQISSACLLMDIDDVEAKIGYPKCVDEDYDDCCEDGHVMYRTYEEDADGNTLKLYYNSKSHVLCDYQIRNY